MWICPECRSVYEKRATVCERDGAPVAEVQAHQTKSRYPLLGKVIGERYHLIGGLGQGGLGTVYLAKHLHLGQLFAVKFLDLDLLGTPDEKQKEGYRKDFVKEARVASLVRHDAVVKVSDYGEYDGMPFLVMEYVPGPSLLHVLANQGRFEESEAINIARRIAEALNAFHERQLVHRDLKPANVILDPRGGGRLTLVDLGLVKDLTGEAGKASTHPLALRGTPGYLAPEQVPPWVLSGAGHRNTGSKQLVDARVDIYALGVILYEMLAGVSPYPDGTSTQIIVYACTKDPISLQTITPPITMRPGLEALVYSTMAGDPELRPASASAFLELLDEVTIGPDLDASWPAVSHRSSMDMSIDFDESVVGTNVFDRSSDDLGPLGDGPDSIDGGLGTFGSHDSLLEPPEIEIKTIEADIDSFNYGPDHEDDPSDDLEMLSNHDLMSVDLMSVDLMSVDDEATRVDIDGYGSVASMVVPSERPVRKVTGSVEQPSQPNALIGRGVDETEPPPPLRTRNRSMWLLLIPLLIGISAIVWFMSRTPTQAQKPVVGTKEPASDPVDVTVVTATPIDASTPPDARPKPVVKTAPARPAPPKSVKKKPTKKPVQKQPTKKKPAQKKPKRTKSAAEDAPPPVDAIAQALSRGDRAYKALNFKTALRQYQTFRRLADRRHKRFAAVGQRIIALKKLIAQKK